MAITIVHIAPTGVTPGAVTSANITIDQEGRITAATSGSSGGGWTAFDYDLATRVLTTTKARWILQPTVAADITTPAAPTDGDVIRVSGDAASSTLITNAGQSFAYAQTAGAVASPITIVAGQVYEFVYRLADTTWYGYKVLVFSP